MKNQNEIDTDAAAAAAAGAAAAASAAASVFTNRLRGSSITLILTTVFFYRHSIFNNAVTSV